MHYAIQLAYVSVHHLTLRQSLYYLTALIVKCHILQPYPLKQPLCLQLKVPLTPNRGRPFIDGPLRIFLR